jgi:mannose-1-phosphate guanylyltransferase
MIDALILVGGLGTRLRPAIGTDTPKPMADVAGRPFLAYLLAQLRRDGFGRVVLATGHGAEAVERYFGTGESPNQTITYSSEPAPLGTGGALRYARPRLHGDRVLVMNGDSFLEARLGDLVDAHARARRANPALLASLCLARVDDPGRYGAVECDADGTIRRFREKSADAPAGLINAGIYVVERALIDGIPEGRPVSLEREVFPALADGRLHGVELTGSFVDIGIPEAYAALRADPSRLLALIS